MHLGTMDTKAVTAAIDTFVEQLLDDVATTSPPVDAIDIARRIGVNVAWDASQPGRGRHKRLDGTSAIFLKPDERLERLQWAAGHELGEVFAWQIFQMAGLEPVPALREQIANLTASRLLLPENWFPDDMRNTDADLLALKRIYSTASHELIAMRLLDSAACSIITVFDHNRVTRRRANGGSLPRLQPLEHQCQKAVHDISAPCSLHAEEYRVDGWPVHEAGWKREILRTTPVDHDW